MTPDEIMEEMARAARIAGQSAESYEDVVRAALRVLVDAAPVIKMYYTGDCLSAGPDLFWIAEQVIAIVETDHVEA